MRVTLLVLLFSISLFSQTSLIEDITEKNKQLYLKKLKKYKNKRSYTYAEKEALKVQREDIIKSKVILIGIKKGSVLIELSSDAPFITTKEIIARAFQQEDYDGYRLLIDKNNKVKYKVRSDATSNLKTMLTMREEPKYFEPVKKKVDYNRIDKDLLFNYDLSFTMGLAKSSFLNEITNSSDHFSNLVSYELSVIGNWKFPVQAGFTTNYETQTSTANNIAYSMNSLLLGVVFEVQDLNFYVEDFNIGMKLSTELVSRLNLTGPNGADTINISKNVLNLYFNKPFYKVFNGYLLWGINYSRQWLKAKAISTLYSVGSRSNTNNIFALSLTYRGDWK